MTLIKNQSEGLISFNYPELSLDPGNKILFVSEINDAIRSLISKSKLIKVFSSDPSVEGADLVRERDLVKLARG
jgi:hypothetical protein